MSDIIVNNKEESVNFLDSIISNSNSNSAAKNIALINAAALLFISGKSKNIAEGIKLCEDSLKSMRVFNKVRDLIKYTNTFKNA